MKNKIMDFLGKAETFGRKNSPTILTGCAIVGVLATAYSAFKAGPRAQKILEDYRRDMADCHPKDKEAKRAVKMETAKKMVPVMAPTVIMGGVTIASMVGSHSISSRRIAVLSAAYTLSESTVKSLNTKMDEILGEKKARAIKDAVMKDKLARDAEEDKRVLSNGSMIMPSGDMVLCKDLQSGRLFYSNAQKIQQAINECGRELMTNMYVSLNEFYEAINSPQLERTPMGDKFGWNVDDCYKGQLPVTLTALLLDDGRPVLCIDYDIGIRDDYRNLH